MTFLRRMHLDPLLGSRGRPRHWIQRAHELLGSCEPTNPSLRPNSPILQLLPPLPQGLGYWLDLRTGPIPAGQVASALPARARIRCNLRRRKERCEEDTH